jgi:hypothetical protein
MPAMLISISPDDRCPCLPSPFDKSIMTAYHLSLPCRLLWLVQPSHLTVYSLELSAAYFQLTSSVFLSYKSANHLSFELFSGINSHPAVFFSHNKPTNSIFSHNKPAKRTGCKL